jgi:hypothetical protein
MTNIDNNEKDQNIILVSKTSVVGFIVFALSMTFFLMLLFTWLDFESLLGRKNLAMKVGATSISLKDFKTIKEISGNRVKNMSDQSFAAELFEILLLAEDARRKNLGSSPEFKKKIQKFDLALKNSEDSEKIARSIYLHEELAQAAIQNVLRNATTDKKTDAQQITPVQQEIKLHLRTIKVNSASEAEKVKQAVASGTSFAAINASHSTSLYKAVGGDLGIKSRSDFPPGVFAKLAKQKNEQLTLGFNDETGFHFFQVIGRHKTAAKNRGNKSQPIKNKNEIIYKHIASLKTKINHWINPKLLLNCGMSAEKQKKQPINKEP